MAGGRRGMLVLTARLPAVPSVMPGMQVDPDAAQGRKIARFPSVQVTSRRRAVMRQPSSIRASVSW